MTRVIMKRVHHGVQEASPTPIAGSARILYGAFEELSADEQRYQICESTEFDVRFFEGTEERACDADETACAAVLASVATGSERRPVRVNPCASSRFGDRADFEITASDYSESFLIQGINNCGSQVVTLNRPGRALPPSTAASGEAFAGFEGERWVGDWTANQTVFPGERCPGFETTFDPNPPRPATICLEFVVSCPGSDDCP
jgi:hypothetical protein